MEKSRRGFTLVEILVAVAIIAILSAIIYVSLGGSRERARDSARIAEVTTISEALETYYSRHREYPEAGTYRSNQPSWQSLEAVLSPEYIPRLPTPPSDPTCPGCNVYSVIISETKQEYSVGTYLATDNHPSRTGNAPDGSDTYVIARGCLDEDDPLGGCHLRSDKYRLTYSSTAGGRISSNPSEASSGSLHSYGTSITLTATVQEGYEFGGWSEQCTSTSGTTCNVIMNSNKNINARFTLNVYPLSVSKLGSGSGTIKSTNISGINCGDNCEADFDHGTIVRLTATEQVGSNFTGWSGGTCSGSNPVCEVSMTQARNVTANFTAITPALNVTKTGGTGTGTVSSSPSGINCGSTCSRTFAYGTSVTLTPAASTDSSFIGWSGACSGTGTCQVTMNQARNVNAQFDIIKRRLTISRSGTGTGTVSSSPSGINCGGTCSTDFNHGTVVDLTASAPAGNTFNGWSGSGCSGTGTCRVTMSQARSVTATFTALTPTLTVSRGGTGSGTVTSSPSGINCGSTCSRTFAYNTSVTLTPSASSGSSFAGWSGACSGTSTCRVTMSQARSVTATFTALTPTLTVSRGGTGSGTVTSSPSGINCGSTCSRTFAYNTSVTLTPSASSGSSFAGWSGACSGTSTCRVTMSQARSVTATFNAIRPVLTINRSPSAGGTVSGASSGSNHAYNANVRLTASPNTGYTFTRWTGCTSTSGATCNVTMNQNRTVTATFTAITPTLTVSRGGTGSGTVTSSPSGISCGSTCSRTFAYNTSVTLSASPATGSTFAGWSGSGCSGTGTCRVTMSQARSVTATFTAITPTLTVSKTGTGSGTVTSSPSGINCGSTCSRTFAYNTSVTLTPSASSGSSFAGWSGACSGTSTCRVTMSQARSVTARFDRPLAATISATRSGAGNRTATYTVNISGGNGNTITYTNHTCGGAPNPTFPLNPNRSVWRCTHAIWLVNPSPIRVIIQQSGGATLRKQFNWSNGSTTNW